MTPERPITALIAVDVQTGFKPGGSLPVPDGNAVVPVLTAVMPQADYIILSRDYHPNDHMSFVRNGGIWPAHCVQGTADADIDDHLLAAAGAGHTIISKGTDSAVEAYSAFDGTDHDGFKLVELLRNSNVSKVIVGGLATDYCVKATVLDALKDGFETLVLTDGVRAVDVEPGDGQRALEEMQAAGARLISSRELAGVLA